MPAYLPPQFFSRRQVVRSIDLDETPLIVCAESARLHGWYLINLHTAALHVKVYDVKEADFTIGENEDDLVLNLTVPGTSGGTGAGANFNEWVGIDFRNGILAVCTTGIADDDTTGADTNDLIANFIFSDESQN